MEGKAIQVTENSKLSEVLTIIAQSKGPVDICFEFQQLKFVVQSQLKGVNPPKQ